MIFLIKKLILYTELKEFRIKKINSLLRTTVENPNLGILGPVPGLSPTTYLKC
jgi:hypothetical protein